MPPEFVLEPRLFWGSQSALLRKWFFAWELKCEWPFAQWRTESGKGDISWEGYPGLWWADAWPGGKADRPQCGQLESENVCGLSDVVRFSSAELWVLLRWGQQPLGGAPLTDGQVEKCARKSHVTVRKFKKFSIECILLAIFPMCIYNFQIINWVIVDI